MRGPNLAPNESGSGGSNGSNSSGYPEEWLQDKLLNDIEGSPSIPGPLPQDLAVFWGYAATADRDGYARLYLNLQFNEFLDFEKKGIVFFKDMGGQDKPFSGVMVWLRRDAIIQHVRVEALDLQRNFLQGSIPSGYSSASSSGYGGGSMVCGGGGSMVCGGGGSMVCGGGGSMVCGGGGSMVCGGGGSMVCGGGGSMVCGGGGSMVCGGGGSMVCGGGGSMVCGGGGSMVCGL